MKRYPSITLVTVRCSCCNEKAPHDRDHAVCQYDPATQMVVCPNCEDEYILGSTKEGIIPQLIDIPDTLIDYETLDMDEDD